MAYTIAATDLTITAADINNNFLEVAQGNLIPKGGATLTSTDSVYELGNSSFKWAETHVQNINVASGDRLLPCMNLIAESPADSSANRILFEGLNGEVDKMYYIVMHAEIDAAGGAITMHFNEDSGTNYYSRDYTAKHSVLTLDTYSSINTIVAGSTTAITSTSNYVFNEMYCFVDNDDSRVLIQKRGDDLGNSYVGSEKIAASVWSGTDTFTSMTFKGNFETATNIQIWALRST